MNIQFNLPDNLSNKIKKFINKQTQFYFIDNNIKWYTKKMFDTTIMCETENSEIYYFPKKQVIEQLEVDMNELINKKFNIQDLIKDNISYTLIENNIEISFYNNGTYIIKTNLVEINGYSKDISFNNKCKLICKL